MTFQFGMALAALLVTLATTAAMWWHVKHDIALEVKTLFDAKVRERQTLIEQRLRSYRQALRGVRGLFEVSGAGLCLDAFKAYVNAMHAARFHQGMQVIGFLPVEHNLNPHQKARWKRLTTQQGRAVWQRNAQVIFVNPQRAYSSKSWIKNNILREFEPVHRLTLERARDSGRNMATREMMLVNANATLTEPGFLMYLPVYRERMPLENVAQRRKAMLGWVYAAFSSNNLLHVENDFPSADISLQLHDTNTVFQDDLSGYIGQAFRSLEMAGRTWQVTYRTTPAFESQFHDDRPVLIAVCGMILAGLLGFLTYLLASQRTKAIMLAKEMTNDLRQKEAMISALSAKHVEVREEEGRRIAREIHDEIGQRLSLLRMDVSQLPRLGADNHHELQKVCDKMRKGIDACIKMVRNIASSLRPATLEMGIALTFETQIEEFAKHTGIACKWHNRLTSDMVLDDQVAIGLYRILQESLTNIARHAHAKSVNITLYISDGRLNLTIRDDGIGFDTALTPRPDSYGLVGMRERAELLGGDIEFISTHGGGTLVLVSIPLSTEHSGERK